MTDENYIHRENLKHDEVVLEKTGRHVEVFGPYTKKDLRRLLLSSLSLYPETDNEQEIFENIGISEQELRNIQTGINISEDTHQKLSDLEITDDMIKEIVKNGNEKSDRNFIDKQNSDNFISDQNEENEEQINFIKEINQSEKTLQNREENVTDYELSNQKNFTKDMKNQLLQNSIAKDNARSLENFKLSTEKKESLRNCFQEEIKKNVESVSSKCAIRKNLSTNEHMSENNFYLKSNFSEPIKKAMCEIILRKPKDPIEFLAHWLIQYREREKKRNEGEVELLIEPENSKMKETSEKEIYYLNEKKNRESDNESENTYEINPQ